LILCDLVFQLKFLLVSTRWQLKRYRSNQILLNDENQVGLLVAAG